MGNFDAWLRPEHDGQIFVGGGEEEDEAGEAAEAAEVGGEVGVVGEFVEAEFLVEGDEGGGAGEPEGTAVLGHEVLDEGAGDAPAAPGLGDDDGGEFAGSVVMGFDLGAADGLALLVYGDDEAGPV